MSEKHLIGMLVLLSWTATAADMNLAPIFTDRMVVAAGKSVRIFGTGDGEAVVSMNDAVEEGRLYVDMLAALVGQWRLDFGDARLPFVVVQIAVYPYEGNPKAWCKRDAWTAVQMSQRQIAKLVPYVTSVCSEDVCEADKGIHPPTKWRLAERMAMALRNLGGRPAK